MRQERIETIFRDGPPASLPRVETDEQSLGRVGMSKITQLGKFIDSHEEEALPQGINSTLHFVEIANDMSTEQKQNTLLALVRVIKTHPALVDKNDRYDYYDLVLEHPFAQALLGTSPLWDTIQQERMYSINGCVSLSSFSQNLSRIPRSAEAADKFREHVADFGYDVRYSQDGTSDQKLKALEEGRAILEIATEKWMQGLIPQSHLEKARLLLDRYSQELQDNPVDASTSNSELNFPSNDALETYLLTNIQASIGLLHRHNPIILAAETKLNYLEPTLNTIFGPDVALNKRAAIIEELISIYQNSELLPEEAVEEVVNFILEDGRVKLL